MSKKPVYNPTPNELKEASNWLIYEYWMLTYSQRKLSNTENAGSAIIHNAMLDSFLIHARSLIDFLILQSPPKSADVIAYYFLDKSIKWGPIRLSLEKNLSPFKDPISQSVAHLTYERRKKAWDQESIEIVAEIKRGINEFYSLVPREKLGSRWDEIKGNDIETALPSEEFELIEIGSVWGYPRPAITEQYPNVRKQANGS